MAIEIIFESREALEDGSLERVEKHFSTEQEEVKNIVPEEDKVGIHLKGETLLVPWSRVFNVRLDLDPETVQNLEKDQE